MSGYWWAVIAIAAWSAFVACCVVFGLVQYQLRSRGPSSRPGPPK